MLDETARRTLRQAAKRGGAVSAGAIVALLAGGSLAVGASSGDGTTPANGRLANGVGSLGSTATGLVPNPAPQAKPQKPGGGLVGTVTGTVTDTLDTTIDTVTGLVGDPAPNPDPTDDPTTQPQPGPGSKPPVTKPVQGAGKTKPTPVQHVRVAHNARAGSAASHRAAGLDAIGNFGEQRTNATVTPRLAPGTFDGLLPAHDLGGRGVPGVLVIIATAGVAALGASHLGIWYNRRSAEIV
jgi:hypothetical protein